MKYAVIHTGGKQYKVGEGSEIEVDKLTVASESEFKFDKVLLYAADGNFYLGKPYVDGATVSAKVLEQKKGKKIRVAKFKAKSRYRKVTGHRQMLTKLLIEKISFTAKNEPKAKVSTGIKDKKPNINETN